MEFYARSFPGYTAVEPPTEYTRPVETKDGLDPSGLDDYLAAIAQDRIAIEEMEQRLGKMKTVTPRESQTLSANEKDLIAAAEVRKDKLADAMVSTRCYQQSNDWHNPPTHWCISSYCFRCRITWNWPM